MVHSLLKQVWKHLNDKVYFSSKSISFAFLCSSHWCYCNLFKSLNINVLMSFWVMSIFVCFLLFCLLTALVKATRKIRSDWCLTFILSFTLKTYALFQTVGVKLARSLHSRWLIYYAYSSLLMNRTLVTLSPIWKGEWGSGQVFIWSLAFCPAWSTGSGQFLACWLLVV